MLLCEAGLEVVKTLFCAAGQVDLLNHRRCPSSTILLHQPHNWGGHTEETSHWRRQPRVQCKTLIVPVQTLVVQYDTCDV